MFINYKKRYIFVAIAKTACTSVHRALDAPTPDPPPDIYHMSLKDILINFPESVDFYKFAFVRNPYDRLVSAYYNFRFNPEHQAWATPIYQFDTFKDFVFGFEATPCKDFIHLRSQFDYLQVNGEVKLDFVGKYENLNQDFEKIKKDLGLSDVRLGHHRRQEHPPYEKLYDEETKQAVRRIYKNDFEVFGYEE